MPRNVSVTSGPSRYLQTISVGPHSLQADEPSDLGGKDAGPNPYELLLAALGACTSITVRMYADHKKGRSKTSASAWPTPESMPTIVLIAILKTG